MQVASLFIGTIPFFAVAVVMPAEAKNYFCNTSLRSNCWLFTITSK